LNKNIKTLESEQLLLVNNSFIIQSMNSLDNTKTNQPIEVEEKICLYENDSLINNYENRE
jgi:hypothetical protein